MSADPQTIGSDAPDPAEEVATNLRTGTLLWLAGTVFVFLPPFFAWFYLRSLNSAGQWRPPGVNPPQGLGLAIMAAFVVSAGALALASLVRSAGGWKALVACSLALGIAGVVLQVVEYTKLGFGATSGGYASVFYGWTAVTAAVALATMLWAETLLAYGLRYTDPPQSVVRPRLLMVATYWGFVASLSVVMWLLLYVI
jgi:heme/copper-type cytochrome/quinol oxidase subunit 3